MYCYFNLLYLLLSLFVDTVFKTNEYEYKFDYKLDYSVVNLLDSTKNHKIIYYINSKNNDFFAYHKLNSNKRMFYFLDYKGKYLMSEISDEKISQIEKYGIKFEGYAKYLNPYKYQIKNYNFFAKNDTLINEVYYKQYLLKSTKPKTEKKKKLWTTTYIIDTTKSIEPALPFATAYEIWKVRRNIPNGLIIQQNHFNNNNILEVSEKLEKIKSINFSIIINKNKMTSSVK